MEKRHLSPEFEVICQKQANAKFFVASFENPGKTPGSTSSDASSYSEESTVSDLW